MTDYTGDERRSDISQSLRAHEDRVSDRLAKLKSIIASMSNDMNQNHKVIAQRFDDFDTWRYNHIASDKAEHDRFFNEMAEVKKPVIELKNAIEGMGTISRILVSIAKTVAAVGVIAGGIYAIAHFGASKP